MNTRWILRWGIAALIAMLGLMAVQAWWIWRGVQSARQNWENNLRMGLTATTFRLEGRSIARFVGNLDDSLFMLPEMRGGLFSPDSIPWCPPHGAGPGGPDRDVMVLHWQEDMPPMPPPVRMMIRDSLRSQGGPDTARRMRLFQRVEAVTRQLETERSRDAAPDTAGLDSIYRAEMRQKGIDPAPRYWLAPMPERHKTPVFARISPSDLISRPVFIHADTQAGANAWILHAIGGLVALSALFTLVIGLIFGAGVRMLLLQKRLSDMKQDFIHNMTHELKTPLATISLAATSLDLPPVRTDEARAREYTRIIREENSRILRLIEMVLTMARIDRHSLGINPVATDLHQLLQAECDSFALRARSGGGAVIFRPCAAMPVLSGDPDMLRSAFSNLLDNALKYSDKAPEITVITRLLQQNGQPQAQVLVQDNGIGIAAPEHEKIFERFYRVGSSKNHHVKGFGLGLTFAREVMAAHGGQLRVLHSEPGKGTTFECILPL